MSFLYWLAELRNPVLDTIMQLITHFGEELLLIGIAMVIMWCVDKSEGYYLLTVSLIGIQINQLLKVLLGLVSSLGVKTVSSMLLDPLVGTLAGAALSYGVLVIFAGVVWPLTFRFFGRLGNKEAHSC